MKSNEVDPHLPDWLCEAEVQELELLKRYAAQCRCVTEFGVHDCTSTWALLAGRPTMLFSYDIGSTAHPHSGDPGAVDSEVDKVADAAEGYGTVFQFILGDTREVDIDTTDLLFIDTSHTYEHLKKELDRHAGKVAKFLIFHDTTVFGDTGMDGNKPGLWLAIEELIASGQWSLKERLTNYNGMTVLERTNA